MRGQCGGKPKMKKIQKRLQKNKKINKQSKRKVPTFKSRKTK